MDWFLFLSKIVVRLFPGPLARVCRAIIDATAATVARAVLQQKEDSCAELRLFLLVALVVILVLTIVLMAFAVSPDMDMPVVDGCMSTTADLCVTDQGIALAMVGWIRALLLVMVIW